MCTSSRSAKFTDPLRVIGLVARLRRRNCHHIHHRQDFLLWLRQSNVSDTRALYLYLTLNTPNDSLYIILVVLWTIKCLFLLSYIAIRSIPSLVRVLYENVC